MALCLATLKLSIEIILELQISISCARCICFVAQNKYFVQTLYLYLYLPPSITHFKSRAPCSWKSTSGATSGMADLGGSIFRPIIWGNSLLQIWKNTHFTFTIILNAVQHILWEDCCAVSWLLFSAFRLANCRGRFFGRRCDWLIAVSVFVARVWKDFG